MSVLPMTKSAGCKIEACEKHGDYEAKPWQGFGGRTFYTGCPVCDAELKAEQEQEEKAEKERMYYNRLSCSGISKRFINCTFDNYKPVSEKAIKEAGTSLVLCGRPGTGKTHLANAMAISLINQKTPVTYTTSFKMMARIKATYSKHDAKESESCAIDALTKVGMLIIDEVGVQFGSEAEKVLFYQIINGRYDNVLPTVLISNLTARELEQFIGERCFDRLKEGAGAILSFDWDSYRK